MDHSFLFLKDDIYLLEIFGLKKVTNCWKYEHLIDVIFDVIFDEIFSLGFEKFDSHSHFSN